MENSQDRGYSEVPHTADWALHVWAPDLPQLMEQALYGMYQLMEVGCEEGTSVYKNLNITGDDAEDLIVRFLNEILWILENEQLSGHLQTITICENSLAVRLKCNRVVFIRKQIKAATFHNLVINHDDSGLHATIVFDV